MPTTDFFFGDKLQILQPEKGYRAGIAPLLLAGSVDVSKGKAILDAGAGVGVAACALAMRESSFQVTGIEIQEELVGLAQENVRLNGFESGVKILQGDLSNPAALEPHSFDQVITNPPFYDAKSSRPSPNSSKQVSHQMRAGGLDVWVQSCLRALRPRGVLTLIHSAHELPRICSILDGKVGDLTIYPFWPKVQMPAKLMLVSGVKGSKGKGRILPGLILHRADGDLTAEASDVINRGQHLRYDDCNRWALGCD